jgi:membrane protein DedA with SNARE-associated domain
VADWTIQLIEQTGYVGVFLLMFLETIFPPIPSEVIMPIAGAQAGQGELSLWAVIASGAAGAMLGNLFWYALARVVGLKRFRPFIVKYGRWLTMDWDDVEKAERLFGRFGSAIVSLGRMLPTIRSVISIPAGLLNMRLRSFLLWSTLGTVAWTAALATAGWGLGKAFRDVDKVLGPLSMAVIGLVVALYIWRQLTWRKRHPGD